MARIPDDEIQRLKHEVRVERLAAARGIVLKPSGKNLLGLCPFHDDHDPSLSIDPAQNLWHCFGCQQGGGVIDWVMKSEGVSFRHAVELLRTEVTVPGSEFQVQGSPPTAPPRIVKQSSRQKLPSLLTASAEDQELLQQVLSHYQQNLAETPDALAYLEKRGLHSAELIATCRLGFATRTLGYRLPAKKWLAGAEIRGRLQQLGILRASGHEHFRGCIVVPILDAQGQITEMYGRKITPALRPGSPPHLYLPGPHKGVWNLAAFTSSQELILCEAALDAMTFWVHGYRNVTFSYGVEGFTADHLTAFQEHGLAKVMIAYDADDAGEKGAQKVAAQLLPLGIACYRVHFPKGMDANEYALKTQPAEQSLGLVLKAATSMTDESPGSQVQRPQSQEEPPPLTAAVPVMSSHAEETERITLSESFSPVVPDAPDAAPPEPDLRTSPVPSLTPTAPLPLPLSAEVKAEEVLFTIGDRRYRIRGLQKNLSYDQLRINLFAARDEAFFVDTLDLYHARQRQQFIKQAANELALSEDTLKKDVGKVLLQLEALHDQQIHAALTPKEPEVTLTEAERTAALELLHDPHLLDRILSDFQRCGVVGEETNKLVGTLAAVSRLLEKPLAVLIQSSSAAGKTALMDAILSFLPDEAKVKYSALTGQALFYLGEKDLQHKILALVEEEGAARAAYALKLLQSEGELTIASTGKDPQTGKLVTHEYRVQGPVMILLTTTAVELDDELQNRCLTVAVSEEREQTRAIHRLQREQQTLEGLFAKQSRQHILAVHRNAHRLLRPLGVINPYARQLTFLDTATRTRRDHEKYLTLIASIALLHQYQRPVLTQTREGQTVQYIEVTREDLTVANRLAHEVLGRSLDELAPQTRRLLGLIHQMVSEQCQQREIERSDYRFSRKEVRDYTTWGQTQLKLHLHRLEDLEYLLVHRSGRGQSFVYELLYNGEGQEGQGFLMGLIDPERLPSWQYDPDRSGQNEGWSGGKEAKSGASRPQVGAKSGGGRDGEMPLVTMNGAGLSDTNSKSPENAYREALSSTPSYVPAENSVPQNGRR